MSGGGRLCGITFLPPLIHEKMSKIKSVMMDAEDWRGTEREDEFLAEQAKIDNLLLATETSEEWMKREMLNEIRMKEYYQTEKNKSYKPVQRYAENLHDGPSEQEFAGQW